MTLCDFSEVPRRAVRVGFLGPSILAGGAERWMLDLVRFCDPIRIQWTCAVIAYEWCDMSMRAALAHLIPVYQEGSVYYRGESRPLSLEAAIYQLFNESEIVIGWELDKMMLTWTEDRHVRFINVAHRHDPSLEGTVGCGHYLAAVWHHCRESFGQNRKSSVWVIPNGIDIDRCYPAYPHRAMRDLWGCREEDIVVGYLGRIAPEKNLPALARAVIGLGECGRGIIYGSYANRAHEVVKQMRAIANNQILFYEVTEDIGSVLHAIDVFFLPSRTEGLSLSLLEAWAAGVPVVATAVGALPDLQRRFGKLAILVEPEATAELLSAAVIEAATGCEKEKIRKRAQNLVSKHFTVKQMAREWTDYISCICTNRIDICSIRRD